MAGGELQVLPWPLRKGSVRAEGEEGLVLGLSLYFT